MTYNNWVDPDKSISYSGPPIPACAGVPPIKFCYQYGWFYSNSDATVKAIPMLVFCWMVQLCLILDALNLFPVRDPDGQSVKGSCFTWLEQKILSRPFWQAYNEKHFHGARWRTLLRLDSGERMVSMVQSLILAATECVFVALNVILITDYAHILLPNDFKTLNLKDWTLGQVISVTIWVPVFLEYVYIAAGGPEEIFKGRLHHDYEVVKKPSRAPTFEDEKIGGSSSVELTKLDPVTRPGYERVNSNAAWSMS
ncbi:hypothetical protein LTR53_006153 [Teratosphaeriaceae sp. CCFEE 6253]|nr:hypothetical protein LTR53_006153 [Teratosphaeriaceae sp. CCFEE 6253]